MTLHLPDKWIWDFWLAQDGRGYHVFYLQAPRSLGDPDLRHWNVSVGHAVSQDLRDWRVLPDALHPSEESSDAFDNYTTWTGSTIYYRGIWYLLYTGARREEEGLVQRIGLATSPNLDDWEKHPDNPLIVADPRWYELLDPDLWHDQAWRDPWVFRHPEEGDFHAYITARSNQGPADGRGVIAHARSDDLVHWEVQPPVTKPGSYGHMEVPQMVTIGGRHYLLFSVRGSIHSSRRRKETERQPFTGVHYLSADNPLGPFPMVSDELLVGDEVGSLYAGKLVQDPEEAWVMLATRMHGPDGDFVGALSDPMPVTVSEAGALSVRWER